MKHEAPPILGELEFAAMENRIVFIQHDPDHINFLERALYDRKVWAFTANPNRPDLFFVDETKPLKLRHTFMSLNMTSIALAYKLLNEIKVIGDEFFEFIVLDRIDMMNLDQPPKTRGSQMKAWISMMASKKILRGATLIITSALPEPVISQIANKKYNLL